MAVIDDYDSSRRFIGTVRATTPITPPDIAGEVRQLTVEVAQRGIDFSQFESVGVLKTGPAALGEPEFLRLYAIAGVVAAEADRDPLIELCVRRCHYIDEVSGERYPGFVSNWLCDLRPGATIDLTGPFGAAFPIPEDPEAHLIMIGMGTGIAPFRTLLKRLHAAGRAWKGQTRLFHGARTGLELLYRNSKNADLDLYMTGETFKAIEALSERPHFSQDPDLEGALRDNADDVWSLLTTPHAHVYVAGLRQIGAQLDAAFSEMEGSVQAWHARKERLVDAGRWRELLY